MKRGTLSALSIAAALGCRDPSTPLDAAQDRAAEAAADAGSEVFEDALDARVDAPLDALIDRVEAADDGTPGDLGPEAQTDVADDSADLGADGPRDAVVDGSTPDAPYEALLDAILCEHLARCRYGLDPLNVLRVERGPRACAYFAQEQRQFFAALRPSWAAGALRYDPAVAARCAEHLRGLCLPYPPLAFLVTDLCPGMLVGAVATDGECFSSEDCAPGLSCASVGGCPRRCRAASAPGEVCTASERCTAPSGGLGLCLGRNGEDSRCHAVQERPAADEGAPCGMALASPGGEALVPCRDGLFCAPLGVSGTCQAVRAAGAACEGTDVPCVDGYLCRGGRCVAATVRDASGTSCDPAAGVVCSLVARLACASGRCQPLGDGALGSRCAGKLVPFACTEGLTCRPTRALADSTCQEPAPPGGYCAASADCESFTCDLTDPLSPRCGSRACF